MIKQEDKIEQDDLLLEIKKGSERLLQNLYHQYRGRFLSWSKGRYRCSEEQAAEVYQKAFTIFYLNIKNGKVTALTSTLETYLYGIGKNVFREMFKDKFRKMQALEEGFELEQVDMSVLEQQHNIHLQKVLKNLLQQLGEPCNTVLSLYYFHKFSMEAIAKKVGYKNEAVAKKKKYQCLQGLRTMVGNSPNIQAILLND